jgi:hypothetical protein
MRTKRILWIAAFCLAASQVTAQGARQPASPAAPATGQTDAAFEAAKTAFEALPEAERKAVQEALVWTGDHTGVTTGGFGRRTFEAIQAWQKRGGAAKPDGILDAKARAALQVAAKKARDGQKFAVLTDPKTGVAIGVPQAVLTSRAENPNGGSRWQSQDKKITLDTRSYPAGETDLAALYERNLSIQSPGRQVSYKVLRPDFFVVSGETQTGKFYTRYGLGPGGAIRGFSLGYDKAVAKDFDRTVIAIANSFAPFPEAAAGGPAPMPPSRPVAVEPPRPAGPVATGLMIGPRAALTSAAVESCPDLRVAKGKARLVRTDKAAGLALIELEAARSGTLPSLAANPPEAGAGVVALIHTGTAGLTVVPGEAGSGAIMIAPLQPGASGGPVFDRSGALVGLIGPMPEKPRLVAGIVPPARYALVPAADLARFLSGAGVAPSSTGAERTAGEIAAAAGGAVVPIECAR